MPTDRAMSLRIKGRTGRSELLKAQLLQGLSIRFEGGRICH